MRPIFSAAMHNENIDHSINFWLQKFETEKELTIKIPTDGATNTTCGGSTIPTTKPRETK